MPIATTHIEIVCRGEVPASVGSKKVYNVFHFRRSVTGSAFTKANVIAGFSTALIAPMLAALSNTYTLTNTGIRSLDDALDPYFDSANGSSGAISGDRLPLYNNVTVFLRSANRGRNYRGKKLFAPISEADTVLDQISGVSPLARWNAVATACGGGFSDSDGNTWRPVVFSRNLSQVAVNPTTVVATDVSESLLNLTIGTCKHRKERTQR